jgi:hypothetical protein
VHNVATAAFEHVMLKREFGTELSARLLFALNFANFGMLTRDVSRFASRGGRMHGSDLLTIELVCRDNASHARTMMPALGASVVEVVDRIREMVAQLPRAYDDPADAPPLVVAAWPCDRFAPFKRFELIGAIGANGEQAPRDPAELFMMSSRGASGAFLNLVLPPNDKLWTDPEARTCISNDDRPITVGNTLNRIEL